MATLIIQGIFAQQFVGKESGNGTIGIFDLETGEILRVTWQGGSIPDHVLADKTPHKFVLTGFLQRGTKGGGSYLACTGFGADDGGAATPAPRVEKPKNA